MVIGSEFNAAKIHPSLAAALESQKGEGGPIPLVVRVRPGPIARGEATALTTAPVSWSYRLVSARAIAATPEQLAALTRDPTVEYVWPDLPVHTWLDRSLAPIRAAKVWDSGFTGRGVKIGVIDTGIDAEHPDFADRLVGYKDFIDTDSSASRKAIDPNGHGTHVAGIAAGSGAASGGRLRGVAPEAQLLIGRALDAEGGGRTSQVMAGIEWAVEQGARVVNVSLGGGPYPGDGTDALSVLCDAAVREGVVVCIAAGNLGPAEGTIGSPASARDCITVGAADLGEREPIDAAENEKDSAIGVADFSSRGPTADGRIKPDVLFPGAVVAAARSAGTNLGHRLDEHYTVVSGTSQATPMASGTAALLLQANPRMTPGELKARMLRGACPLVGVEPIAQGAGLGDSYNTFMSSSGRPIGNGPDQDDGDSAPGQEPLGCVLSLLGRLISRRPLR